jgi:hypothetical protein
MQPTKHPKFVRWALALGIVVVLNIFFGVLVALALPAPDYNAYCSNAAAPAAMDAQSCDTQGGVWTENAPGGYCDMTAKCQPLYQAASDKHDLYAFILMIGLGVLALIAGFAPIGSSIVSSGLSYGGVLALVIASAEYWGTAGEWLRFAIALIALAALLYIGWKRFKD